MTAARRDLSWLLALAVAVAAVYAPGLGAEPVYDDELGIQHNPRVHVPELTLRGFLEPTPRFLHGAKLPGWGYRPLTEASFAVNLWLSGGSFPALRAGNVMLHLAASLLVFLLARTLCAEAPAFARWAAAWFALHPMAVQAVTYVWQRLTSLEGMLSFLAILLYWRARAAGRRPGWAILAGLLALLSKETGVTLPVTLAALEWILREPGEPLRRVLKRWMPFAVLLPGLLLVQMLRLEHPEPLGGTRMTPWQYLGLELPIVLSYLRLNAFPVQLSFLHDPVEGQVHPPPVPTLLAGLALALMAGWALFGPGRHPVPRLAAALFLAPLALECSVFPIQNTVMHHRCYPGLLGTGLAFAWSATRLPAACRLLPWAVLGFMAAMGVAENRRWTDPRELMRRDLRHAFRAGVNWGEYAWRYLEINRPDRAERVVRPALKLPYSEKAHASLLEALERLGRVEERRQYQEIPLPEVEALVKESERVAAVEGPAAGEAFLRARAERLKGISFYWDHLGQMLLAQGRMEEAERAYRRALALDPSLHKSRCNLGLILYRRGDLAGAEAAFLDALRLKPDYALARRNLETVRARGTPP